MTSLGNFAGLLLVIGAVMGAAVIGTAPDNAATITFDVPDRADSTPWMASAGSFVAVAWGAAADGRADVFVATSRNDGATFGPPVRVNTVSGEARLGGELPPRVAVHQATGDAVPSVVVLWTARGATTEVKMARSRDGGASFEAAVTLQSIGAAGDRGWPALTVDSRGVAHAVWLDHRGLAARRAAAGAAGTSAAGHHAHTGARGGDGSVMAEGSALYHAAAGVETAAEHTITTGVCYCCKTALAAAPDGTLYAAWRHVYPGDLRDIALSVSRDGGRSFSGPARVSEDGWAINGCPDDGPSIAVDASGTAHIVWPTVVGGEDPQGALFYASTRDGRQFTPRVRIPTLGSPKPMHPQVALDPRGSLVVAWDEVLDGKRVAALRAFRPQNGAAPYLGDIVRLAPTASASHPVVVSTATGLVAAWTTGGDASRVHVRRLPSAR